MVIVTIISQAWSLMAHSLNDVKARVLLYSEWPRHDGVKLQSATNVSSRRSRLEVKVDSVPSLHTWCSRLRPQPRKKAQLAFSH